jgi:hypothetical protein
MANAHLSRGPALVSNDICGIIVGPSPRISEKFVLDLQTVDGSGTYHGLDQHENYLGVDLLWRSHSDRVCQASARQGPDGEKNPSRPEQLPDHPKTPSADAFSAAILN